MSNNTDTRDGGQNPQAMDAAKDVQAAERRRLLLKSLGKGTAVVAAASPLASFAAPTMTTAGTMCSVSGFKSAMASRMPATSVPCGGWGPRRFFTLSSAGTPQAVNWPTLIYPAPSGATGPDGLTFRDLFGGTGAPNTRVLDILASNAPPDLALFIAAYFTAALAGQNAPMPTGRTALPYTVEDVKTQYKNGAYDPAVIEFYTLVLAAN